MGPRLESDARHMVDGYSLLRLKSELARLQDDSKLLHWLLDHCRSQDLKMDGKSTWYFPSNLLFKHRAQTAREALEAAYKATAAEGRQEACSTPTPPPSLAPTTSKE